MPFNNLHLIAIERVADDKVVSVIALGGVRYSASGSVSDTHGSNGIGASGHASAFDRRK